MSRSKQLVLLIGMLAIIFVAVAPTIVDAGQCSGVLVYRDGSKGAKMGISALVSSGGVTKKFYTDSQGRFTITWSSNSGLAKIYVKGSTAATNIRNGATGLRIVVP